jgi:hypothetical protein
MTDTQAARLIELIPDLLNIVGFHDLIDSGAAKTPLDELRYRVHLTASSVKTARVVMQIIDELQAEAGH